MFNLKRARTVIKAHTVNVQKFEPFLYPGKYRLFCYVKNRYIWRKESSWLAWIKSVISFGIPFTQRIKILLFADSYEVFTLSSKSCGNELYVTRKGQIKVFDKDRNLVHYYPGDLGVIERAEHFRTKYATYFENEIIVSVDDDKQCITERYVTENILWRDSPERVIDVIKKVWKSLLDYTSACNDDMKMIVVSDYVMDVYNSCESRDLKSLVRDIGELISGVIISIPTIPQHNDLVLSNILVEDEGITIFDYEFFGMNLFYYDAMMFAMWEAINYGHDIYITSYLNGSYDGFFKALFKSLGYVFNPGFRKAYAELYMISNIDMHLKTGDKTNIGKYRRVLNLVRNW